MEKKENATDVKFLECCEKFSCALSEITKGTIMQLPINGTGGDLNQINNKGDYFPCPEGKTRAEVLEAFRTK
jgi:hypothetical protein